MKKSVIYLPLMALGVFMALAGMGANSFWVDEIFTMESVTSGLRNLYVTYLFNDVHPFLYNTLLFFWVKAFGISETAARSLSFVFSAGTALYVYWRGRQLFSTGVVTLYLLLFLTSFGFIHFAQEARSYSLLVLLSTIQTFEFIAFLRGNQNKAAFYLASVLVSWTHIIGLFLTAAFLLTLFISRPKRLRMFIEFTLLMLVCVSHFIVIFMVSGFGGKNSWVQAVSPVHQIYNAIHIAFPVANLPKMVVGGGVGSLLVALVFVLVCAWPFIRRPRQPEFATPGAYLLALIVPLVAFIALSWLISLYKPIQLDRTMYVCAPLVILIVALFLQEMKTAGAVMAVLVAVVSLAASYKDAYSDNLNYLSGKESYDESTLYMVAACNAGYSVGYLSIEYPHWKYNDFYRQKYAPYMMNARCKGLSTLLNPEKEQPDLVQFNHPSRVAVDMAKPLLAAGYKFIDLPDNERKYNLNILVSPRYVRETGVKTRDVRFKS